jgi:hypothetical protein
MSLPVQHGHAADVLIEKAAASPGVLDARLRAVSARTGHSMESLRRMPADTIRPLGFAQRSDLPHRAGRLDQICP